MPKTSTNIEMIPHAVEKSAFAIPQNTQTAMFTVVGKVKLLDIEGEVTIVVSNHVTNTKIIANPTVGADVDLCAAFDIDLDAVGTMYGITGTFANALVVATSGAKPSQADGVIVADGTIDLHTDQAAVTGSTKWVVHYLPIISGSYIVSA